MLDDHENQLKLADQNWQFGFLQDAYGQYSQLRETSWHAAFQLAWIDACFSAVDLRELKSLEPRELSPSAKRLMETLIQRASPSYQGLRLTGSPVIWDIGQLRGEQQAADIKWWMEKAKQAEEGGLANVAMACWQEAENLSPDSFYDPPSAMQLLPTRIDRHLQALRSADAHA